MQVSTRIQKDTLFITPFYLCIYYRNSQLHQVLKASGTCKLKCSAASNISSTFQCSTLTSNETGCLVGRKYCSSRKPLMQLAGTIDVCKRKWLIWDTSTICSFRLFILPQAILFVIGCGSVFRCWSHNDLITADCNFKKRIACCIHGTMMIWEFKCYIQYVSLEAKG